jgi:hypothetical protein
VSYLLRIELPDVPGSLGNVAGTVGRAGANIEAIEIIEHRPDGVAVDDFVIRLSPGVLPDMVVSACQRLPGVRVLWVTRYPVGGNLRLDLETVEHMTMRPHDAVATLVAETCDVLRCDWAIGLDTSNDGAVVIASTAASPDLDRETLASWLPIGRPVRIAVGAHPGLQSAVVGAVPVGSTERVIAFGRRGGPEILDSELARMAHLAALAASIEVSAED